MFIRHRADKITRNDVTNSARTAQIDAMEIDMGCNNEEEQEDIYINTCSENIELEEQSAQKGTTKPPKSSLGKCNVNDFVKKVNLRPKAAIVNYEEIDQDSGDDPDFDLSSEMGAPKMDVLRIKKNRMRLVPVVAKLSSPKKRPETPILCMFRCLQNIS